MIIDIAEYIVLTWCSASILQIRRLNILQNALIRMMFGAPWGSSCEYALTLARRTLDSQLKNSLIEHMDEQDTDRPPPRLDDLPLMFNDDTDKEELGPLPTERFSTALTKDRKVKDSMAQSIPSVGDKSGIWGDADEP